MLYLFVLGLFFAPISSKSLPSNIRKCSKSDPNFNKCLEESAQDASRKFAQGNKDLGIVPLEPFHIKKIDLGNNTSGAVTLHQIYENMDIYGMTNSSISDSEANFTGDNCYWNYKVRGSLVRMVSDYTMSGQLLIFPINGHGKCTNYLYDYDGDYEAKCERYIKKNKTCLRVTDFKFGFKPKRIVFDFENIIDGNEQLSKEVVKTLNENSETVYADVGPAFNQVMGMVWKQTINQVFSRVPEDELFLP
ncbi:protein takeout-like [Tribolium madens]|uniref:protein takeout-like n=1 Tax=Tribolium madens TaxID=41895 RepID=UPI001CF725F0|nr:protein takeout-like [Tribolium madens]